MEGDRSPFRTHLKSAAPCRITLTVAAEEQTVAQEWTGEYQAEKVGVGLTLTHSCDVVERLHSLDVVKFLSMLPGLWSKALGAVGLHYGRLLLKTCLQAWTMPALPDKLARTRGWPSPDATHLSLTWLCQVKLPTDAFVPAFLDVACTLYRGHNWLTITSAAWNEDNPCFNHVHHHMDTLRLAMIAGALLWRQMNVLDRKQAPTGVTVGDLIAESLRRLPRVSQALQAVSERAGASDGALMRLKACADDELDWGEPPLAKDDISAADELLYAFLHLSRSADFGDHLTRLITEVDQGPADKAHSLRTFLCLYGSNQSRPPSRKVA